MQHRWRQWVHVTKLDPAREHQPGLIEEIATSGTDALMLSGTLGVTRQNMGELLKQVAGYDLPVVIEPASPEVAAFDGRLLLFVPSVLNARDVGWVVGKHVEWVKGQTVHWERVVPEAYIVLNPESSVASVTKADCTLGPREVAAYTRCAERYFRFPIVYIEYSGTYGDPAMVRAAREAIEEAQLFYGGGINSAERAAEMANLADTIVVGNAVYESGAEVLRETVRAVQ
ncbi:MAG: phosphoglycerol geranylgeranyltransferase [Methanomicrobiales archaeon]|nr:phosphoglycerol geranylgeranyltransferase [Methanomicrobiales archaeon]